MKNQYAFSFLELMMVLIITSLFMAMSLPFLSHTWDRFNQKIILTELLHAISTGREEANLHHHPIILCSSKNLHVCGGEWLEGRLLFLDQYEDGLLHEETQIIQKLQTLVKQGELHWRSFPIHRDNLSFFPLTMRSSHNGTFWYCKEKNATPAWAVMVNVTGRTRIAYPDSDGVLRDTKGQPLHCESTSKSLHWPFL